MGTRVLELDTIQYPSASTENIQVGNNSVTFPSGISVDINGGAIDGTPIGAGTASTGAFTTLSTTGTATLPTVNIDGGNIDGATIATSDITVGSSKTLDVSGGTLTTSTAQKQAVVDGATIEAQDLATGSGTTLPNAVQDNITRLGSVTQGTIGSGVTQNGVPRLIKALRVSGVGVSATDGTKFKVMFNGINFSAVSGRLYHIVATFSIDWRAVTNQGGSSINGYVLAHASTTNRSAGYESTTNPGDTISSGQLGHYINVSHSGNYVRAKVTFNDLFSPSSTATHYYYHTAYPWGSGDSISYEHNIPSVTGSVGAPGTVLIYEYTGVTLSSHTPS